MEQMQTGCWFTHMYAHSSSGINLLTHITHPAALLTISLVSAAVVLSLFLVSFLKKACTVSQVRRQEHAPRSRCYSLLYYLNGTS